MARIVGRIERQGPISEVRVMASPQRVTLLKTLGRPYPAPATVRALIDTGASATVVDDSVIRMLSLDPTGSGIVHTPTTGPSGQTRYFYDVSIGLGDAAGALKSYTVGVVASSLASEGFLVLIGWDILSQCLLHCDGPNRIFTLDY